MADLWLPFKLLLLFYWMIVLCGCQPPAHAVPHASEGTNTNTHHLFSFCLVGSFIWADRQMLPLVFRLPALALCSLAGYVSLFFWSDDTYSYNSFQWRSTRISSDTQALRRSLAPGYQGRPTKPPWGSWHKAGVTSNKPAAKITL